MDEVASTLTLDKELLLGVSECKKVNAEYVIVTEKLSAKKKEHEAIISLRDKVKYLTLSRLCLLVS